MAEFPFTLQGEAVTMLVTAVRGHLYETEFDASAKNWRGQVAESGRRPSGAAS